jgi:hypothetical protein
MKVLIVFAFVAFANSVFAVGNLNVSIFPLEDQKAVVAISSIANNKLSITVTDELNQTVLSRQTNCKGSDYQQIFNFSQLEDGNYRLTAVCNCLTTERSFQIKNGKIEVGDEKTELAPFFSFEDRMLKCSYLNFSNQNLKLQLFENNNMIYSKNIGNGFVNNHGLNLAKLQSGTYTAILTAGEEEYTYNIEIN